MTITRLAALMLLASVLAVAADPFVGTWKPNLNKWKTSTSPDNIYRTLTIKWEAAGNDQYRTTSYTPDGKPRMAPDGKTVPALNHFFDGIEHPRGTSNTVIGQRLNERNLRETIKGPKGTTLLEYFVSADGKTLTQTVKGTGNDTGRPLDEVLVYERQ
jgi:hypothetical protein